MARKDSAKAGSHRGFNDIAGFVFIGLALLLMLAQFSFDPNDVARNRVPPNPTVHNWIGSAGAYTANALFFMFGAAAFAIPIFFFAFGLSNLVEVLGYLRRRKVWATILFISLLGFFDTHSDRFETLRKNINAHSAGGLIGDTLDSWIFDNFGKPGATIIFVTAYLVSLVFLTNFRLGDWARAAWIRFRTKKHTEEEGWTPEERVLAKKARDLEKQARKLQEETERERSGLGADLKPVPAPTVRDLSVPQPRVSKTTRPKVLDAEPEKDLEGEVISAREIAAATTTDILGKSKKGKPPEVEPAAEEDAGRAEPVVAEANAAPPQQPINVTDNTISKAKKPLKKKPIAVAATPNIGNYQLPTIDFLQLPDTNVKPTESKEELMANARLMQSTLAQFGIEVALGDITKGPTITRYELHPAPGVKLEKITALNNNIAAALKAERINILAPVPGKSSVGVEVPNIVKTKVIMRDLLESEEWQKTKARIPLALGKDVYGHPIIADLSDMPHLLIAGSTGSGKSVCINCIIASLLYRFPPDQLRFVMIDPKVVELQQYNTLPHLVVPVVNDPKKVILALRWVVNEMEKRYQIFAKVGVRNIRASMIVRRTNRCPRASPSCH
jgi:S-DNA-T family DNA segregation ATPase FtsK/SpoIIIE